MATLDAATDSVVVRIVYDGPPAAGKTTSLQALASRLGQGALHTPEVSPSGRTLFFDWLEYTGGRFEGRPIRCQIVSVPGQHELGGRRRHLLDSADAVVFVADTSRAAFVDSRAHFESLLLHLASREGVPVGVVLQANKRDVADAVPLLELRGAHPFAIIESVAARGEGVREAFVFAIRLALDRVRELRSSGALETFDPNDSAEQTLKALKALPLDGGARELWPVANEVEAAVHDGPRLPDVTIPSGWVWPPINGRMLLQEATSAPVTMLRELAPAEWLGDTAAGWRFHSPVTSVFSDAETARAALIRWAQVHAALAEWTSAHRCIALCETGDGRYRLWQIVRNEKSMWKQVAETLSSDSALDDAAKRCAHVAEHWLRAPFELPCTLETVGTDGAFISLLPDASHVRVATRVDRTLKLSQQLETMRQTHQLGSESSLSPGSSQAPPNERGRTFEAAAKSVEGSTV